MRALRFLLLASSFVTLTAACDSQPAPPTPNAGPNLGGPDSGSPPVDASASSATLANPPLPKGAPDTPAGHQLAWVLAGIATPPSEADVSSHFTPDFFQQIPLAATLSTFNELHGELDPLIVESVVPGPTPDLLGARVKSAKSGLRLRIEIKLEPAEPHRMRGLSFRPDITTPTVTSWQDVQTNIRAVGGSPGFLAASIDGDKCTPISEIDPTKPEALGSAFKLYILDALAREIAANHHAWNDTIPIDDALKSLPSGALREEPAGTTFTVREYAEKMISVSDNTAADHLLKFVGRAAAEQAVKATHHADPTRMIPFLSTRDLFAIKLLATDDEQTAYVKAPVAQKRKMLADFEKRDLGPAMEKAPAWKTPRLIDRVEWFASPLDLCNLMVDLKSFADQPATAPVGAILSINPGLPDDAHAYKYIGFKGGSEPGVLTMSWLLQRDADGKWFYLSTMWNDMSAVIDAGKAIGAAASARDFLAKTR